jgi:CelD/BcsL family acetyltransferase involved in cellulose biosynthesis
MFKQSTNPDQWHDSPDHKLLASVREVEGLAKSWNTFNETSTLPMQQFGWIKACATTFSSTQELKMVVYGTSEKTLAIAPLVRNSTGKNGRLEMAGLRELSEPSDLIWADRQSLERLVIALTGLRIPLILDRLPADSPSIDAFKKAFHGKGVVLCREGVGYPFIPLNESWRRPEQNLSSRRASDLRRALRKAEKIGPVKTEILSPQPNELAPLLNRAFAIEANSWKGRVKTALAKDVTRGTFFRQYAHYACQEGMLRTCFLHIGDQAAAMQLAVECGNHFWLLKIGYDEQFGHCSPGNLLLRETIKYAAEKGLDSYDFLGQVEDWTLIWTSSERPCVSLRAYPFTLHGINALGTDVGQSLYRKLKARVNWRNK